MNCFIAIQKLKLFGSSLGASSGVAIKHFFVAVCLSFVILIPPKQSPKIWIGHRTLLKSEHFPWKSGKYPQ